MPRASYAAAYQHLDVARLEGEALWPRDHRRQVGQDRLRELLQYAVERVPAYAGVDLGAVAEQGPAAFPMVDKSGLRSTAEHLATGVTPVRWNRTSGSTNVPLRTPLGTGHEPNQIVRWLRHWRSFGVEEPAILLFLVPRAYRLRVFGGGELYDLAGGHVVHQRHPGSGAGLVENPELVIANPHVLEEVYPDGWELCPRAVVTSYEQRPSAFTGRWRAGVHGDVYGLSEVGDVAWQRVDAPGWHQHEDLVTCEVLPVGQDGALVVGELVVTDLTNRVLPILRYRTGDIVAAAVHDRQVSELRTIVGRRIQVRGTPLAGLDVMSVLLPALLDTGEPFRVGASQARVVVYSAAGAAARARLHSRLVRLVAAVTVTEDPMDLVGLSEVLQAPTTVAAQTPAALGAHAPVTLTAARDCRCAPDRDVVSAGSVITCDSGQGPRTLLCLPPGPGIGHQILRSLHDLFAGLARTRIVEYPLHGYGSTGVADRESLLRALAGLLDGRQVLLGHSFGADLAVDLAVWSPGVVGLVLLSPPKETVHRSGWSARSRVALSRLRAGQAGGDWHRRYLVEYALPLGLDGDVSRSAALLNGVPTYERAWRTLRGATATGRLGARVAAARIPTLIVSGRDDPLVDHAAIDDLAALPNTTTVRLTGAHFPFLDAPEGVREAVSRFLESVANRVETRTVAEKSPHQQRDARRL